MDPASLVISFLAIFGGSVIVYSFRTHNLSTALGLGGPIVVVGLVLLMNSYELISGLLGSIVVGAASLVSVRFIYVTTGRNPRILPFLGVFVGGLILLLTQVYLSFPLSVIFAYVAISLAVLDSSDLSRANLDLRLNRMGAYFRALLMPFSISETAVRRTYKGTHTRLALFSSYLVVRLVFLIGLPILLVEISGGALRFETMTAVFILVVLLGDWEISKNHF